MSPSTTAADIDAVQRLLFDLCPGCRKMSAFPPGMHAVFKVRSNMQRHESHKDDDVDGEAESGGEGAGRASFPRVANKFMEELPTKYSDKLMKSIWGFYNRYSVHNLKNIEDGNINNGQQLMCSAGPGGQRVNTPPFAANWDAMWFSHI